MARKAHLIGFFLTVSLAAPVFSQTRWTRVHSENLEMYSSAAEARARDTIRILEQVRAFFLQSTGIKTDHLGAATIVAFRLPDDYARYKPPTASQAFSVLGADRDYVVVDASDPSSSDASAAYATLMIHQAGVRLPTWLDRALPEFYGSFVQKAGPVVAGDVPPARRKAFTTGGWVALDTILNAPVGTNPSATESFALVHMLSLSPDYAPKFKELIVAVQRPGTPQSALEKVYGKSIANIEADLKAYIVTERFGGTPVAATSQNLSAAAAEAASPLDVNLALAGITNRPGKESEAIAWLDRLSKENPSRPEVWTGLGYVALRQGRLDEANQYFQKASSVGGPDSKVTLARLMDRASYEVQESAPELARTHITLGSASAPAAAQPPARDVAKEQEVAQREKAAAEKQQDKAKDKEKEEAAARDAARQEQRAKEFAEAREKAQAAEREKADSKAQAKAQMLANLKLAEENRAKDAEAQKARVREEAEEKAKAKAEQEANAKSGQEAKAREVAEAREKAAADAREKLEAKAREQAEVKAAQEARAKEAQEAKEKALADAREKADAKARQAQEAHEKAVADARTQAEEKARAKAAAEADLKATQEAKAQDAQEARERALADARQKAEEKARSKAATEENLRLAKEAREQEAAKAKEDAAQLAKAKADSKAKNVETASAAPAPIAKPASTSETPQDSGLQGSLQAAAPPAGVPQAEPAKPFPATTAGTFVELGCGEQIKVVVQTAQGRKNFLIKNPANVIVSGPKGGTVDLECGPQKPVNVRIQYGPSDAAALDGLVQALYFE